MKSVAFYNNKGGVGKTTFAVHCALRAALHHRLRTVAVGMDRQGDILRWLSGGEAMVGDGAVHRHSPNLAVVYSPNQQPNFKLNVDLLVLDASPSLALAGTVQADLVVIPVDGRLAVDDLQNALPDLTESRAKLLVVPNRADGGGKTTLAALRRATAKVPNIEVWSSIVPQSPALQRSADYYRPVWETPYGAGSDGDKMMRALCDDILKMLGLRGR
jgi:cellulose biosynthesis protein BcsQ